MYHHVCETNAPGRCVCANDIMNIRQIFNVACNQDNCGASVPDTHNVDPSHVRPAGPSHHSNGLRIEEIGLTLTTRWQIQNNLLCKTYTYRHKTELITNTFEGTSQFCSSDMLSITIIYIFTIVSSRISQWLHCKSRLWAFCALLWLDMTINSNNNSSGLHYPWKYLKLGIDTRYISLFSELNK